jgi:hypothetical protein
MPQDVLETEIQQDGTAIVSSPQVINFTTGLTVTEDPSGTAKVSAGAHHTAHESGGSDVVTFTESQVTNLVTDLAERIQGYGFFGSGVDGNVTLSANTTLTGDVEYQTVTVNTNITITLAGFRFLAWEAAGTGTLTLVDKGTAGGNASGSTKGSKADVRSAGYLPAPNQGADGGGAGANGSDGTGCLSSIIPVTTASGLVGKNSATKSGGAGGTKTTLASTSGGMRNYVNLQLWRAFASASLVTPLGHAGNGGSAGGASGGGGASGNNGGYAIVSIRKISGTLVIDVTGGAGGNGASDGSGGDGGNGGIIGFIYHQITGTVTYNYTGGAGGTGYATGTTGLTGVLISLQL